MISRIRHCLVICYVFILISLGVFYIVGGWHGKMPSPHIRNRHRLEPTVHRITSTRPSISHVRLIDPYSSKGFDKSQTEPFPCVQAKFEDIEFPMCLYQPYEDTFISAGVLNDGLWEKEHVATVMSDLRREPGVGFVDIGANLGSFSLTAAHLGFQVVAVEPTPQTLRRLASSAVRGGVTHRLRIVGAGVSNKRTKMYEKVTIDNKGRAQLVNESECRDTRWSMIPDRALYVHSFYICDLTKPVQSIYLDDLIDVIPFQKAVMKIDIEGHEYLALQRASLLFDKIDFVRVHMEWVFYKLMYQLDAGSYNYIRGLLDFFLSRGYSPQYGYSEVTLNLVDWQNWPDDITWHKRGHTDRPVVQSQLINNILKKSHSQLLKNVLENVARSNPERIHKTNN